ncbi:MAG: protoporphyrinogen oxidase [Planctomycetia bacterium]
MNIAASATTQPSSRRAVVIGGGLAGLAAAESLVAAGWRVTVVESSGRLGGVIETVRRDGWLVERSADSFLAVRPEGTALVERLGLSKQLLGVEPRVRRALILRRGRAVPVPAGFRLLAPGRLSSILTTPLLSPAGRLRVAAERFVSRGTGSDESLERFAVRRLGREAFERLVQPLVAGIWTADPAKLSMAAACPEFLEMERRSGSLSAGERLRLRSTGAASHAAGARYGQFVTLAAGMETLPLALGRELATSGVDVLTATVERLERFKRLDRPAQLDHPTGGWRVQLQPQSGIATSLDADAVVVAVPAPAAAAIVGGVDRELAAALGGLEYAGSAVVSLGFARDDVAHPLDAAGIVVPRSEGRRILAASFSSSKFPGRAPEGHVLVRTFVGGALDPSAAALDDEPLVALVRRELADVIGARGTPKLVQIDRWTRAMPQYHLGHVERVAAIRRRLEGIAGLAIAGAAYEGVGIPQTIASGQHAAATLLG